MKRLIVMLALLPVFALMGERGGGGAHEHQGAEQHSGAGYQHRDNNINHPDARARNLDRKVDNAAGSFNGEIQPEVIVPIPYEQQPPIQQE